jgi:O-antigen ligase
MILGAYMFGHLANIIRIKGLKSHNADKGVFTLAILFLTLLLVATLSTDPKFIGFIGDTQRRNGYLSYLMLVIIFLFAYFSFNELLIFRVFKIAIFTGLVLAVYGVFQINGKDFVAWQNPYNSMISTLGNPNFASAMLAVFASLGLFSVFLKNIGKSTQIFGAILVPIAIYCIVRSDSRQGLVTFFFSVLFFLTILVATHYKKFSKIIILFSLTSSLTVVLGMLQKGPFTYWLYKDSVSVRGFYWRAGIEMLQGNFLTGVGMDRYGSFFKFYREAEYPLRYGYDITSSNAHNTIIQIFSTAGFFAGLAYVFILIYIIFAAGRFIKRTNGQVQMVAMALLSAWIGFQAQSFISIDNLGVSVWGWLLGGSLLGYIRSNEISTSDNYTSRKIMNTSKVQINLFQPIISISSVIAILFVVVPIYKSETDSYLVKSLGNSLSNQNKEMLYKYSKKVLDNNLADPNYKFRAALYMYDAGYEVEAISTVVDLSKKDPKSLDFLNALSYLFIKRNQLEEAITINKKIEKLDPWNAQNYLSLASLFVQLEDEATARKYIDKVIEIAPVSELATKAREILKSIE